MSLLVKIRNIFTTRKYFFRNKKILVLLTSSLVLNLLSWIYIYINIRKQGETIFLHYNIYYGVDLIGNWYQIYLYIPLLSMLTILVNTLISYILFKRNVVLSYVILGLNIFLQIVTITATYLIVQQNI